MSMPNGASNTSTSVKDKVASDYHHSVRLVHTCIVIVILFFFLPFFFIPPVHRISLIPLSGTVKDIHCWTSLLYKRCLCGCTLRLQYAICKSVSSPSWAGMLECWVCRSRRSRPNLSGLSFPLLCALHPAPSPLRAAYCPPACLGFARALRLKTSTLESCRYLRLGNVMFYLRLLIIRG